MLLVHGFTGSPYELHLLAAHLHAIGYSCLVPRLAGHHQSLATLAATGWADWLGSAEAALHELHRQLAAGPRRRPASRSSGCRWAGF